MNARSSQDSSDRLRTPPAIRFEAPVHTFDLRAVARELMAEHAASSKGHWQKTLYRHNRASIALFVFQSGSGIAAHKAAGAVTIHVIEGRLRINTGPLGSHTEEHLLGPGNILVMAPNVQHDVHALEESTMLLQVYLEETNTTKE
jgi:quercetin dioxygenase-like cupin family protein